MNERGTGKERRYAGRRALVLMAHPGHAGIMRSLAALDRGAAASGWELSFAFPRADPVIQATRLDRRACYVPAFNRWRRLGGRVRLPLVLAALVRELRRRRADLVYSATLSSFPYGLLAARACGAADVVHVYSSYDDPDPYRKYWLRRARNVIAPSRDSLERAATAIGGFAGRSEVIYNGVDVAGIEAAADGPLPSILGAGNGAWLAGGPPVVGMVANLDRRKNPVALLEAAARLTSSMPGLRVLLVGEFPDGEYREVVLGRARTLGIATRVTLTGFLVNPFPALRACDVIVLPTQRDPFPIALLEAMALGKPVVSTAVGGIPEMLVDGVSGFVVPPDDVDALASRMLMLLRDRELRRRMGQAARERLVETFSLDGFVHRMFGAFDAAMAGR
jgi:glycosyltransferase involved in cell wall biosynthesis